MDSCQMMKCHTTDIYGKHQSLIHEELIHPTCAFMAKHLVLNKKHPRLQSPFIRSIGPSVWVMVTSLSQYSIQCSPQPPWFAFEVISYSTLQSTKTNEDMTPPLPPSRFHSISSGHSSVHFYRWGLSSDKCLPKQRDHSGNHTRLLHTKTEVGTHWLNVKWEVCSIFSSTWSNTVWLDSRIWRRGDSSE